MLFIVAIVVNEDIFVSYVGFENGWTIKERNEKYM